MYIGDKAIQAIHEQRVRELLAYSRLLDEGAENTGLLSRLRSRIVALQQRSADPKNVYSAPTSKSLEQTS